MKSNLTRSDHKHAAMRKMLIQKILTRIAWGNTAHVIHQPDGCLQSINRSGSRLDRRGLWEQVEIIC